MNAIELFSGAGGLALGVSNAGFTRDVVVERDKDCCRTIRHNQAQGVRPVAAWPLHEMDVRQFDYSIIRHSVDLLAAGPPCQPFSLAGNHKGIKDDRNMFPEIAKALRFLSPKAFIIENVRGILRPSFAKSLEYMLLMLRYPEITRRTGEKWTAHTIRFNGLPCQWKAPRTLVQTRI